MVTAPERGAEIERRRRALGIRSQRALGQATGLDRGTIKRAEDGTASAETYAVLDQWFTGQEPEGTTAPPPLDDGDPVELALERSGLSVWRRHAVLAEYHRHRHEQEGKP